jgi:hypothetical protein
VPAFSQCHAPQGGFQILKRLSTEKAKTIRHLTLNGPSANSPSALEADDARGRR